MADTIVVDGEVSLISVVDGEVSLISVVDGIAGTVLKETVYDPPAYTGETTVTPSAETQTLETSGLTLTRDITINPIPSNYGLITWDGNILTVS